MYGFRKRRACLVCEPSNDQQGAQHSLLVAVVGMQVEIQEGELPLVGVFAVVTLLEAVSLAGISEIAVDLSIFL
jgi:hypothetical protein